MIFTDKNGKMMMVFHSPNTDRIRIKIVELKDNGNFISRKNEPFYNIIVYMLNFEFWKIADYCKGLYNAFIARFS